MEHTQAIQLWNNACYTPFGGEWGEDSQMTVFGGAVLGADCKPQLHISKIEENQIARTRAANWLRSWAAAIEGDV